MNQTSIRWRALAAVAAAMFAAACTQSNGDINRVQPNVAKKADLLDGVWFFRNTVTWTPASTGFTYPGQTGNIEKLVFEIQEKNVVGYRAYPFILGAEIDIDKASKVTGTTTKYCDKVGKCTGGQKYYGAPVVAFPIESHFDIQRNYNAATGEQGNVIAENASDRPWNQREYLRIDWSANLLNVNSGLNWGTIQNPSGGSSTGTWIQANEKGEDPTDWPTREYDANGKLTYMDYTGRYMANPDLYYFEDYGYYPTCFLRGGEQFDCSSSEIRMRISMSKVDPVKSRDYEPLQYDNDVMSKFGYFRTERLNYDRKFGVNNSAVIRLANRHRIWKSSYEKGTDGDVDSTKPIPMASRELRPILYYFTRADLMGGQQNYDEYMIAGRKLEAGWDKAFRRAAAAAQGKQVDLADKAAQAFYLCDNPVKEDGACGKKGFSPKFGDLRYSFMNTIAEPVANGLLGYGPSSADPETGEIISANANTYLWGIDLYGREVLDTIDLLLGETSINEFITGNDIKEYIKNNPSYSSATVAKNGQSLLSELQGIPTRNEQTRGAFDRPTARSLQLLQSLNASGGLPRYSQDSSRVAADILAQHPALESAVLDNPDLGDDVVHLLPAELQARAIDDKAFRRKASRSVLTNIKDSHDYQQKRIEWASRNNIYLAEFNDRTLMALANRESATRNTRVAALTNAAHPKCLKVTACTAQEAKLIANDEISSRIRQGVWEATSEHEIGHTFGLRHNFQGSFDAINYHDGYWDLRKESLTVVQGTENKIPRTPADLKATADGTIGQLLGGMYDNEYSSIMDYAGKINGDWSGVGKYDEAAILFAYSGDTAPGYVEVFKSARREKRDFAGSDGALMTITGAGLDLPIVNAQHKSPAVPNYTERYHYSVAPLHFGDGANGAPIKDVINSGIAKFRERQIVKYSVVKAANDALAAKLDANPEMAKDPDAFATAIGASPMLEVPYMFCSDDHVGGVLSCNRFDRGPDYYEMARTHLEDYYNYYFSNHFKRDRYHFSSRGAFGSTYGAFWDVADIYKKWVFEFFKKSAQTGQEIRGTYPLDPMLQDYWTMAVLDGINQHLNVMSVPPTGMFMLRNLTSGPRWDIVSEGDDYDQLNETGRAKVQDYYRSRYNALAFADLPRGLGRRMYSRYDYKSGFGFFNRMQEAGHYNDQMGAMYAAVFPDATFLGADENADSRRFNIPYYLVFKKELTDTFSALWGNQEELVRPIMYLKKNGLTAAGQPKVGTPPVNGKCESGCTIAENSVTPLCTCPSLEWKRFVNGADLISGFNYPRETGKLCTAGQTTNCLTADQKPAQANIQLTWTSRIYSIYLGEALFRVNYDLDYAKANQVFKLGGGEQQTVATGFHAVEVQDITTGSRYAALEKDGAAVNSTPAIREIGIAKDQLQMLNDPTKCPLPPYLADVGYACMGADEANNPALVEERRKYWTDIFRDTIRDLDLMRGMYTAYGKAF
jgi:hypothetical protein